MTLKGVFGERISHSLWPVRSPDLNPCIFYLWGNVKDKAYRINPALYQRRVEEKHTKRNFVSSSRRTS
jgi:hypothetical protein